ncbi:MULTISPECIES: hypothetical protein [Butyricimonas]|uniref:hypothetical protein n=1 Tax=Butyricimonas TaxID=574697 RepID=UPI0007FB2C40|nr:MULTISPECIES: hypothetical protein [Butyricimonas]
MIGFELIVADKSIKSALKSGVLSIMISGYEKRILLLNAGQEEDRFENTTWCETSLNIGDSLTINVIDINEQDITEPESITKMTTWLLIEEYNSLKKKLDIKD